MLITSSINKYSLNINKLIKNTIHLIEPCETTIIEESYGTSIQGDQCIFPFTYKGITYDSCVKTDDAECEWCPVKLDASGVYIAPGEWGCCNDACPKTIDKGKKILLELQSNYKKKILVVYCNDLPIARQKKLFETFGYSFT